MTALRHSPPALPTPCLCLVTDRRSVALPPEAGAQDGLRSQCGGRPLEEVVAAAVDGGVTAVQLREPDLPARDLWELAVRLRPLVAGRALFLVNDRIDVALAAGADGVQLGGRSLPLAEARRLVGEGMLLGRSVHSASEAALAREEGADFLVLGTIFETASHPGVAGAGPDLVRAARARVDIPILAIGGIKAGNAPAVMSAGADGVAVISAILAAADPRAAAAELWESISVPGRVRT